MNHLFVHLIFSGSIIMFNCSIISDILFLLFYNHCDNSMLHVFRPNVSILFTSVLVWGSHTGDEYSRSGHKHMHIQCTSVIPRYHTELKI